MKHATSYRVRALGTLWDGSETWGEVKTASPVTETMHGPAAPRDGALERLFPDFAIVIDYEVLLTRTLTKMWRRVGTRYTSIHETDTLFHAWSDPHSEERWHALEMQRDLMPVGEG